MSTVTTRVDPITFEVLRNAFMSVVDEMGLMLERVGHSLVVSEGRDFSAAICDPDGRMVAEQRLHTAHTDARPHTRQPRPLHDHHSRHARAQEIREVSHAPLADQAGRINDRPLGWGGDLLARCCGGAVGRTLAAKRPAK